MKAPTEVPNMVIERKMSASACLPLNTTSTDIRLL